MRIIAVCVGLLSMIGCGGKAPHPEAEAPPSGILKGDWRIVMKSPGGDLPFTLRVREENGSYAATVLNGAENLPLDRFEVADGKIRFGLDHYESYFDGLVSGTTMTGVWTKVIGDGYARLDFQGEHGNSTRFPLSEEKPPVDLAGNWAVVFDNHGDPQPAVGQFQQDGNHLWGTFLTPVGDYRFLEGVVDGTKLYLSCFDGGHAFLFSAELGEDGTLVGDFYSRDSWHESWTATRNPEASLEDPYAMTSLKPGLKQFRFAFPDLQGRQVTDKDPSLQGKVRLITIFGSWCPNCNDEAPFLEKLYREYGPRGLEVVGLAFEMTEDEGRSRRVLRRFIKRHNVSYRILLAGGDTSKSKAGDALPDLTAVRSYPTTLLLNRRGEVVFVHTGFNGPGTGIHYQEQVAQYREAVEAQL